MTAALEPNHRAVLEAFARHCVEYVLVGGVALQLHGWQGSTADVDLAIATTGANVERLNRALAELGAGVGMPGRLGTTFQTGYGRVELVTDTSGVGPIENWAPRARLVDVAGLEVRVGHPEDLLTSKTAAGREKDLDALPAIRRDLIQAGTLDPERAGGPVASPDAQPPGYLVTELGPRPPQRRAGRLWDHAAQRIAEYRTRWAITDEERALGRTPDRRDQAVDRAAIERMLQRTRDAIDRAVKPPTVPSIDLDP